MAKEFLEVHLESNALPLEGVRVVEVEGIESISKPFELELVFASPDSREIDHQSLIGEKATLTFKRDGIVTRQLHALIYSVADSNLDDTTTVAYRVVLLPRVSKLSLTQTIEIYMDLSVPEIVTQKLTAIGFKDAEDFEWRLTRIYPKREFVVQYKETDLAFISRLCEHLGIWFVFEHEDGRDKIVFGDNNLKFEPIPLAESISWVERQEHHGIFDIEHRTRMLPIRYMVRDYNYRSPLVDIQSSREIDAKAGGGQVTDYGDHFKTPEEANWIATLRAEEVRALKSTYSAKSSVQAVIAGATFRLENHPRFDQKLLVTRVVHHARRGDTTGGEHAAEGMLYTNEFHAIPLAIEYRPPRETPKPKITGLLNGVVQSKQSSPYADLDEGGRYKVRFLYDTAARPDGQASHYVRMAQPNVGENYGMHFPLRAGKEVVIACVDGDPDRPIIVGGVPNPATDSPVNTNNVVENRLRTAAGNELRMNDTTGQQRIILHSPHADTVMQLGASEHPETGFYMKTEGSSTHVAASGQTLVTTAARDLVERSAVMALHSVIQSAGFGMPGAPLEQQQFKFEDLVGSVRGALEVGQQMFDQRTDVMRRGLESMLQESKETRDDALDQLTESMPESSNDEDEGDSSEQEEGGPVSSGQSPSLVSEYREKKNAALAAVGFANGVAMQAHENLEQFAKRVDAVRKLPLFGKQEKLQQASQKLINAVNKVDKIATTAAGVTGALQAGLKQNQDDPLAAFKKKPERLPNEPEAVYKARVAAQRVDAAVELMNKAMERASANGGRIDENPEESSADYLPYPADVRDSLPLREIKKIASSLAEAAEAQEKGGDPNSLQALGNSVIEQAITVYERAVQRVEHFVNRFSEYIEKLKNRVPSLFMTSARKVIEEVAKKVDGGWTWNDMAHVYSVITERAQRTQIAEVLSDTERLIERAAGRSMRATQDTQPEVEDTDGVWISVARRVAAVMGEDAVLSSDRSTTISSRGVVSVIGAANTFIQSSNMVEVSAPSGAVLSSKESVDLLADHRISILAHPRGTTRGTGPEEIPDDHTMLLRSLRSVLFDSVKGSIHLTALQVRGDEAAETEVGDITFDANHEILGTAKKKIHFTSTEDDIIATTLEKDIKLLSLEKDIIVSAKKKISIASAEDSVAISAKSSISSQAKNVSVEGTDAVALKSNSKISLDAPTISASGKLYLG